MSRAQTKPHIEADEGKQDGCRNFDCLCEDLLLYILKYFEFSDLHRMKCISKSDLFQPFIQKSIESTKTIIITKHNILRVLESCCTLQEIHVRGLCFPPFEGQKLQLLMKNYRTLSILEMEPGILVKANQHIDFHNLTTLSTYPHHMYPDSKFTTTDFPQLQSISLNIGTDLPNNLLLSIKTFTSLTELKVLGLRTQADLNLLTTLPCSKSLKTLHIGFRYTLTINFSNFSTFPNLTELGVQFGMNKFIGVSHLANCCSNLKNLIIHSESFLLKSSVESHTWALLLIGKNSQTLQSFQFRDMAIIEALHQAGIVLPSLTRMHIIRPGNISPCNLHLVAPNVRDLQLTAGRIDIGFFNDLWNGVVDLRQLAMDIQIAEPHIRQIMEHNLFSNLEVFTLKRDRGNQRVDELLVQRLRMYLKNCLVTYSEPGCYVEPILEKL